MEQLFKNIRLKQLFKYMSEPRDLFNNGYIRLSQPVVLNDPFEASFCRKSLEELSKYFDNSSTFDPELGKISFSEYIERRMNQVGVISFSENKENLLMWAHYANEHRGIVAGIVEFPEMSSIFHNLFRADFLIDSAWGEEWSQFDGKSKPISYRKGLRYRNDKFDYDYSNISAEGPDRFLYEIFMQKSDEWIYEQEHRIILRLEQADRVIIPSIETISNTKIKKKIKTSPFATLDRKTGRCIVDLLNIKDEAERVFIAKELAKLNHNPKTIYLMKLSSSSINNCLLGLKSPLSKSSVQGKYACSKGRLHIWKAKKNEDYYSLEFKKI